MKIYEIEVDGKLITVDDIRPAYEQQDSEKSGRVENLDMYREVLGVLTPFYITCEYVYGQKLQDLKNIIRTKAVTVKYYNWFYNKVITEKFYAKQKDIQLLNIGGTEYAEKIEISFIPYKAKGI